MKVTMSGIFVHACLSFVLTAAIYGQVQQHAAPIEKTQWALTWVEGHAVESTSPRPAYIELDPGTHKMSGSGGCNRLMGGYELDGNHLRIKGTARTMMACKDTMGTEGKLVTALEQVRRWKISGDELELMDDGGHDVAKFSAATGQ